MNEHPKEELYDKILEAKTAVFSMKVLCNEKKRLGKTILSNVFMAVKYAGT